MFIFFFIIGFLLLILPLFGIKKFASESIGRKITRIAFMLTGLFLIFVAGLDAYSVITDPSKYSDRLIE